MIIVTMSHRTSLEQREPYINGHKQFIQNCIGAGKLIAADRLTMSQAAYY